MTVDGRRRFLDWQTVCLAPWADDVAYFLVGILDVERRRSHEVELLRHYLEVLSAGVPHVPTFEDAWRAYREHHLHGLMFALCPADMQPPDVCTPMGQRYGAAALDPGTLALLTNGR
ncbi:oxidoreductase family protein [Mycolicibacterium thermoresistibile]